MSVTHTSVGFAGTVDQVAEAKRFALATAPFRAGSATDWQVTAVTTANQTVQIGTGAGFAYGVRDSTSSVDTVQVPPNTGSATRYDAIVATFDWTLSTPAVSFGYVVGTSSPPAVKVGTTAADVDTTKINRIPGYRYDAVLAVTKLAVGQGAFGASDVVDSRLYGGFSGALVIPTATWRSAVDVAPGSRVLAADTAISATWTGSAWRGDRTLVYTGSPYGGGAVTGTFTTLVTVSIPDPGYAYRLLVDARQDVLVSTGSTWNFTARVDSVSGELIRPVGVATSTTSVPVNILGGATAGSYTGAHTVIFNAEKVGGVAGDGYQPSTVANVQSYRVLVVPA
jgi:hypothetical protein